MIVTREKKTRTPSNVPVAFMLLVFLAFLALFVFNLLKLNSNAAVDSAIVEANIEKVATFDYSEPKKVEAEITALHAPPPTPKKANGEKDYRAIFKNCVVVGDSITEGLVVYKFLGDGQVVADVGASLKNNRDYFDKAAKLKPQCVFFVFGINDMGNYSGKADLFIGDYKAALQAFIKKCPDTKVYVCSLHTPSKEAIKGNKIYQCHTEYNKVIQDMCKELNIKYVDISNLMKGHEQWYADDGIHVAPSFYPLWLDLLQKEAGL